MYDNIKLIKHNVYKTYFFYNGKKFYIVYNGDFIRSTTYTNIGQIELYTPDGRKLSSRLLTFFNLKRQLTYHILKWHIDPTHKSLSI